MYAFHLDHIEKVLKITELQSVQGLLEAKLTELKLEGKENKQLDSMVKTLDETVLYLHELYDYAEKEQTENNHFQSTLLKKQREIDSLSKQLTELQEFLKNE